MPIGEILVQTGVITQAQLQEALQVQEEDGRMLGYILEDCFGVDSDAIADARIAQEMSHGHDTGDAQA
jgi:hypothetical protein